MCSFSGFDLILYFTKLHRIYGNAMCTCCESHWVLWKKFVTDLKKTYLRKTQFHIFKKAITFLSYDGKSISLVLCIAGIEVSEISNTTVFLNILKKWNIFVIIGKASYFVHILTQTFAQNIYLYHIQAFHTFQIWHKLYANKYFKIIKAK